MRQKQQIWAAGVKQQPDTCCPTKDIMGLWQTATLKAAMSVVSVREGGASVCPPHQEEEAPEDHQ